MGSALSIPKEIRGRSLSEIRLRIHGLQERLKKTDDSGYGMILESQGKDLINTYGYVKIRNLIRILKKQDSNGALLAAKTLVAFLEKRHNDLILDHDYDASYETLKRARSIAETIGYNDIIPVIDFNLGYVSFSFLQDYTRAVDHFSQAIDYLDSRKRQKNEDTNFDSHELANSYRWRAYAYFHQGSEKEALRDFSRAIEELKDLKHDSKAYAIIADCYESTHLLTIDSNQVTMLRKRAIDFKKKAIETTFDPFWKYMSQARVAQMERKTPEVIHCYEQALVNAKTDSEEKLVKALLLLFRGRAAVERAVQNCDEDSIIRASKYNQEAYEVYPIIICKHCWHLYSTLSFLLSRLDEIEEEQFDDTIAKLESSKEDFLRYHKTVCFSLSVILDDLVQMINRFKMMKTEEDLSLRQELAESIQKKAWSIVVTANSLAEKTQLSIFSESIARKLILSTASMSSLPNELRELLHYLSNIAHEEHIESKAMLSILGIVRECTLGIEEHKRLGTGFIIGDRNALASILSSRNVGIPLPSTIIEKSRRDIMKYIDAIDGTSASFLIDRGGNLLGAAFLDASQKVDQLEIMGPKEYNTLFCITSTLPVLAVVTPRTSKTIKIFKNGRITCELVYFEKWRNWSFRNMEYIAKILNEPLGERGISDDVFQKIWNTAQMMSERRIGGSFIIGDHATVLRHSEAPRIQFKKEPNILSMGIESILSFAKQENALVISADGILKGASVRLCARAPSNKVVFLPDDGTRHKTAIEMTAVADRSIGIIVSENGPISICVAGERILPAF